MVAFGGAGRLGRAASTGRLDGHNLRLAITVPSTDPADKPSLPVVVRRVVAGTEQPGVRHFEIRRVRASPDVPPRVVVSSRYHSFRDLLRVDGDPYH